MALGPRRNLKFVLQADGLTTFSPATCPKYTREDTLMTHPSDVPPHGPGDNRPVVPGLPQVPPGARLLSANEAIERLVVGDHRESNQGSVGIDAALIELIREGQVVVMLDADDRLAFTLVTDAR